MKLNRYILQWLSGAAISLITGLAITGCTDDIGGDFGEKELGKKVKGTVSVNFGTTSPTTASRARTDFDPDASIKIDSYWVGLFDTQTGELIGTKYDTYPRKSNDTRWTLDNDDSQNPFVVEDIDLYYYDNNPEAYIVGVINFNDVEGKNAGDSETKPLIDLLNEVKYFEDVCKISVDVKTAEAANSKSGNNGDVPVMMGFYTTERTTEHTTVTNDGKVSQDAVKIRLANAGGADLNIQPGAVRLQRLMAEMNIIVVGSSPITKPVPVPGGSSDYPSSYPPVPVYPAADSYLQITNLEYKVVNSPAEVFLAEHPTDRNAYGHTSEKDYLANTANSADYSGAYLDYPTYMTGNSASEGWTKVYSSKVPTGPSEGASVVDMYFFRYQHYENKHWGSPQDGRDNHSRREAKWDSKSETPVFKSLCPSEDQSWNNNASYIVLKADIEIRRDASESETTVFEGTVYYTIHEGYSRSMNSGAANVGDFETVRNTSYYYVISIAGIEQLLMNVGYADFGEEPDNAHNDGISGQLTGESFIMVAPNPDPREDIYEYVLPPMTKEEKAKKLKFAYGVPTVDFDQKTPEGEPTTSFTLYGNLESSDSELLERLPPILSESYEYDIKGFGDMPDNVKESVIFIPMVDGTRPMTITDYLEAEEVYDEAPIAVRFTAYEEKVENLDYVSARFFMFNVDGYMSDADGCSSIDEFYKVYVQPPIDNRAELRYFEPFNLQSNTYNNTKNDIDFNVYSYVKGMSDIDYIRWYAASAQYEDPDVPGENINPYDYGWSYDDTNIHQPIAYKISIDGVETTINHDEFPQYLHRSGEEVRVDRDINMHYAYPINLNDLEVGDHKLVITPVVNSAYVKPVEPIEMTLRIVEKAYWDFDGVTFPQLGTVSGCYSYGGMTACSGVIVRDGYVEFQGTGRFESVYSNGGFSNDNMVLRFNVGKHGTFRVVVRHGVAGSTQPTRNLNFGVRENWTPENRGTTRSLSKGITYNDNQPETVEFHTRDLIDKFENGEPVHMAIYAGGRLYVHSIEWIPDEDQRPGLNTSNIQFTNQWRYYENSNYYYYYIHNDASFYYSGHYIVPGVTTYFGFTDDNPRATSYVVGLYDPDNHETPVYTSEFVAEDCRTFTRENNTQYFVCPLYVRDGILTQGKGYDIAITPKADSSGYAPGAPHFLSTYSNEPIVKVIEGDAPTWWNGDDTYYPNPFYNSGRYSYFRSTDPTEKWEYQGLVLHGGSSSISVGESYIGFDGTGYPANGWGATTGRYLSFTVDKPGKVEITAQGGGDGSIARCFRLYNTKKGLAPDRYVSRAIFSSEKRVTLSMGTGAITEPTEFIICPEGKINLYGIKFVPSNNPDDYDASNDDGREVLDISSIKYSEGTTHIGDNEENSSITMVPNLMSYISIYNENEDIISYNLRLYRMEGDQLTGSCDYEETFDADDIKSGENVYTFPILLSENCANNNYAIQITPIGDESKYRTAMPMRLSRNVSVATPATSDSPLVWFDDTNPFNGWEGINTAGAICEYNGLVLHGGSASTTLSEKAIQFGGNGYPLGKVENGRYLSFTTSQSGKVVITAQGGGSDRYFRLYKASDISQYIERVLIDNSARNEYELVTGSIADLTEEFIICPEGGVTLYSVKFVPD